MTGEKDDVTVGENVPVGGVTVGLSDLLPDLVRGVNDLLPLRE